MSITLTTRLSYGYYRGRICFLCTTDKKLSKAVQNFKTGDEEFSCLNLNFRNPNGENLVKQEEEKRKNSQQYNSLFVDNPSLFGDIFTFQYEQEFMDFLNEQTNNFEGFNEQNDEEGGLLTLV